MVGINVFRLPDLLKSVMAARNSLNSLLDRLHIAKPAVIETLLLYMLPAFSDRFPAINKKNLKTAYRSLIAGSYSLTLLFRVAA